VKLFAVGMLAANLAFAAPMQAEVPQLLAAVEKSGCEFNRNGSWHDAKKARAHLQSKYDYLVKKNLATTTEDFIERGATKSSTSGQKYLIKCAGAAVVPSAAWLTDELKKLRKP